MQSEYVNHPIINQVGGCLEGDFVACNKIVSLSCFLIIWYVLEPLLRLTLTFLPDQIRCVMENSKETLHDIEIHFK